MAGSNLTLLAATRWGENGMKLFIKAYFPLEHDVVIRSVTDVILLCKDVGWISFNSDEVKSATTSTRNFSTSRT